MATGGIQIQHLLKLNFNIAISFFNNSTIQITTLVKVKIFYKFHLPGINLLHSNTTLVKVKSLRE